MKNWTEKLNTLSLAIFFSAWLLPVHFASAQLTKMACPEGLRCPGEGGLGSGIGISGVNSLIYTAITYMLGITFALAILFVIIGGLRYIVSGGNEESAEKGKKTIVNALIGIIVIVLSYIIVNTLVNTISSGSVISP